MSSMSSRRLCSVLAVTFALVGSLVVSIPAQQAPGVNPSLFADMKWRNIGPYRGGPDQGGGRRAEPAVHLLYRHGERRRVEDDRRRAHLEADLRRPADRIDRLGVGRAVRSERRLRRQRRRAAAPRPGDRRRHLQVDRRRQDLDAPRPARRPADSEDRHRSEERRIGCSSPRSDIPTAPTRSAASSARPTAARRSSGCSSRTRTPAARTSTSIPSNPDIVYATLWEQRQGPWENGAWGGTNGGIFKSTDGGTTWKPLTKGLPDGIVNAELDDRAEQSEAPLRDASRRTGERHRHLSLGRCRRDVGAQHDGRASGQPHQRGGAARPPEGSRHADRHRRRQPTSRPTAARRACRSRARPAATTTRTSGGTRTTRTSCCWSIDQGAVVTLNGGQTLELVVHPVDRRAVPRDDRQRVSLSRVRRPAGQRIGRASRAAATTAQITMREWHPVGVEEYGYAAPDPLDPDIVYGGKVTRYDRRTGQVSNVGPVEAAEAAAVAAAARRRARPIAPCARSRSCSRRSTSRRCSTATTCCGRRSTAASTGSRSAPT